MKNLMNRKKDGGFTLIELMIVIAIIGILAVVLVPRMTSARDQAKAAGVTTNAKSIEAFVVANIDRWVQATGDIDQIAEAAILAEFATGSDAIENPFTGATGAVSGGATPDNEGAISTGSATPYVRPGVVTVTVTNDLASGITITGYGNGTATTDIVYSRTITRD